MTGIMPDNLEGLCSKVEYAMSERGIRLSCDIFLFGVIDEALLLGALERISRETGCSAGILDISEEPLLLYGGEYTPELERDRIPILIGRQTAAYGVFYGDGGDAARALELLDTFCYICGELATRTAQRQMLEEHDALAKRKLLAITERHKLLSYFFTMLVSGGEREMLRELISDELRRCDRAGIAMPFEQELAETYRLMLSDACND